MKENDFSWGEAIEQALRHKIFALLAGAVARDVFKPLIPKFVFQHFSFSARCARKSAEILRSAATDISGRMTDEKITHAVTKGMSFESLIYTPGEREMNDIDFMIDSRDGEKTLQILKSTGFEPGFFDAPSEKIIPHSRKEMIIYAMSPDHLPIHARLTGDPVLPCVHVDFACSFSWTGCEFEVPLDDAFAAMQKGSLFPSFSPEHQFLFTILHLFREAWFERWIEWEQDVNLGKFADILRLFRYHEKQLRTGFRQLAIGTGAVGPAAWVLEHTDRTFGTSIISDLGLSEHVPDWLNSAHSPDGKHRVWKGSMRERLFSKNRQAIFAE